MNHNGEDMKKLLVIGNGFDLSIRAETSYKDFFESKIFEEKKKQADQWIALGKEPGNKTSGMMVDSECDINWWDLLFCLESEYDKNFHHRAKWCDVESVIHNSLVADDMNGFSWSHIFELLLSEYHKKNPHAAPGLVPHWETDLNKVNPKIRIMFTFLMNQDSILDCSGDIVSFYDRLLEELKKFELQFGDYIRACTQQDNYEARARKQAEKLAGLLPETLTDEHDKLKIDTFNYSGFYRGLFDIRHINGDYDNPIFGIDLTEEEEKSHPEVRKFTKTFRRLHQDAHKLNQQTVWSPEVADSVVVFGHSLNKMDYDYFHYLFTMLRFNTMDIEKMGSIVFVYDIYNSEKRDEIRNKQADSIYALLSDYEQHISGTNQHVLINLLRFSGKLTIKEI